MFSPTIQRMLDSSSMDSAAKRVMQIESMIIQKTGQLPSSQVKGSKKANEAELPNFSEILKQGAIDPPPKFKVAEPTKLSKAEILNIVDKTAKKYNVDNRLVTALIKQESAFDPKAVSKAGAQGLMQLMPETAKSVGVLNPFSAVQNVEGGVRYLKKMLDKYNGNVILALAAYNAGPGAVDKYNGVPPYAETQDYVKKILSDYLG